MNREPQSIDGELQLKVAPLWRHGNVAEIACKLRGSDQLRNAVHQLQALLYAA